MPFVTGSIPLRLKSHSPTSRPFFNVRGLRSFGGSFNQSLVEASDGATERRRIGARLRCDRFDPPVEGSENRPVYRSLPIDEEGVLMTNPCGVFVGLLSQMSRSLR